MSLAHRVILKPVVTEKSSAMYEAQKIYTFKVDPKASKPAIRQAVQQMFNVSVTGVRTINVRAKATKAGGLGRGRSGVTAKWKKAYVTLKDGDTIQIFEG